MNKCEKCQKWFYDHELSDDVCVFCEAPWKEHPEVSPGLDAPDGIPSHLELMLKMQVRATRYEITLPFSHDPKNHYVAATIYEGLDRRWYSEGMNSKFKDSNEAIVEVVTMADQRRLQMLNEEFEKEFGNDKS